MKTEDKVINLSKHKVEMMDTDTHSTLDVVHPNYTKAIIYSAIMFALTALVGIVMAFDGGSSLIGGAIALMMVWVLMGFMVLVG